MIRFYLRYYSIDDCFCEYIIDHNNKVYYYSTLYQRWYRDKNTSKKELDYFGELIFKIKA